MRYTKFSCPLLSCLIAGLLFASAPADAGTITYSCGGGITMATCNYLNTTVAALYSNTFTNANANIYITYGDTELASSTTYYNLVPYGTYEEDLQAEANADGNPVQLSAVAALQMYDAMPYGMDDVKITAALASVFGITSRVNGNGQIAGTDSSGNACYAPMGSNVLPAGCYNGMVTMSDTPGAFYYDNVGGMEPAGAYDFYGTVEHETNEILGTASCMNTADMSEDLTDPCDAAAANGHTGNPAAVDLFRYNSAGSLALNGSYIGLASAPFGPYFSYDGGMTNGADGDGEEAKVYNAVANGNDYADFLASTPCQENQAIQDGTGCAGQDAGLNITNDGGGEINILNAVGYQLVPEPGTIVLFGGGLAAIGLLRRRRA